MVATKRKRLAVVVPPGERASELRNLIAAAVHEAGFSPVGVSRLGDRGDISGLVVAFDNMDPSSAFQLGILFDNGLRMVAIAENPTRVPGGVEHAEFRPGFGLSAQFTEQLHAVFGT